MNRIELILKHGQKYADMFSCRQLFNMQREALAEYDPKMTLATTAVLRKHNRTLKEWQEEIDQPWWWYPNSEQQIINREIKRSIRKELGFLPPQVLYSYSVFSGQLSSIMKKGSKTVARRKVGKLYFYFLIENYLKPVYNTSEKQWE